MQDENARGEDWQIVCSSSTKQTKLQYLSELECKGISTLVAAA